MNEFYLEWFLKEQGMELIYEDDDEFIFQGNNTKATFNNHFVTVNLLVVVRWVDKFIIKDNERQVSWHLSRDEFVHKVEWNNLFYNKTQYDEAEA